MISFSRLKQFWITVWCRFKVIFLNIEINEAAGLIKNKIVGRWLCLRTRMTDHKKLGHGNIM